MFFLLIVIVAVNVLGVSSCIVEAKHYSASVLYSVQVVQKLP